MFTDIFALNNFNDNSMTTVAPLTEDNLTVGKTPLEAIVEEENVTPTRQQSLEITRLKNYLKHIYIYKIIKKILVCCKSVWSNKV